MRSMPGLARSNSAAMGVGSHMIGAGESPANQQQGMGQSSGMMAAAAPRYYPEPQQEQPQVAMPPPAQGGESPNAARLRFTVESANEEAKHGYMPTEAEILH